MDYSFRAPSVIIIWIFFFGNILQGCTGGWNRVDFTEWLMKACIELAKTLRKLKIVHVDLDYGNLRPGFTLLVTIGYGLFQVRTIQTLNAEP